MEATESTCPTSHRVDAVIFILEARKLRFRSMRLSLLCLLTSLNLFEESPLTANPIVSSSVSKNSVRPINTCWASKSRFPTLLRKPYLQSSMSSLSTTCLASELLPGRQENKPPRLAPPGAGSFLGSAAGALNATPHCWTTPPTAPPANRGRGRGFQKWLFLGDGHSSAFQLWLASRNFPQSAPECIWWSSPPSCLPFFTLGSDLHHSLKTLPASSLTPFFFQMVSP